MTLLLTKFQPTLTLTLQFSPITCSLSKTIFISPSGTVFRFLHFLVSQFVTYVFDLAGKKLLFVSIKDLLWEKRYVRMLWRNESGNTSLSFRDEYNCSIRHAILKQPWLLLILLFVSFSSNFINGKGLSLIHLLGL